MNKKSASYIVLFVSSVQKKKKIFFYFLTHIWSFKKDLSKRTSLMMKMLMRFCNLTGVNRYCIVGVLLMIRSIVLYMEMFLLECADHVSVAVHWYQTSYQTVTRVSHFWDIFQQLLINYAYGDLL